MNHEKAILAGGCFWGMQDLIRKLPGVISTRVGYTGGDVPNATYRNHGTHAEGIEIVFDPAVTSYRNILEYFFQIHDPTTLNRQGNDRGLSYRSGIYYVDEEQKRVAEETIAVWMPPGCGMAKWSPRSSRSAISGRPNRSTRIIWRSVRAAIPVTSPVPAGCFQSARTLGMRSPQPGLQRTRLRGRRRCAGPVRNLRGSVVQRRGHRDHPALVDTWMRV